MDGRSVHDREVLLGLWGSHAVSQAALRRLVGWPDLGALVADPSAQEAVASGLRPTTRASLAEVVARGLSYWQRRGREVADVLEGHRARALLLTDLDYPVLLAGSASPPPVLALRGELSALAASSAAAVVGTRRASSCGLAMCRRLVQQLVAWRVVVVSGGALGIDAAAHQEALACEGRTVVVCGTGLDEDYPRRHAQLYRRVEEHGALVSPFPPGTPPHPQFFPRRNAVIAGLAGATFLVQTPRGSGALHTSRAAVSSRRRVGVLPGPAFDTSFAGGHDLVRAGRAVLVDEEEGILRAISGGDEGPQEQAAMGKGALNSAAPGRRSAGARPHVSDLFGPLAVSTDQGLELEPSERQLLEALAGQVLTRDELSARSGVASDLSSGLLSLELAGWVERLPGERYRSRRELRGGGDAGGRLGERRHGCRADGGGTAEGQAGCQDERSGGAGVPRDASGGPSEADPEA